MADKLYRVKNWDTIYENNRTRQLKVMQWLPLPVKLNGDGYTLTMDDKNGLLLFGAFIVILEVASTCDPRGTLIRSSGEPHTEESISRISRMKVPDCRRALKYFTETCKWLECVDLETGAEIPHEGAGLIAKGVLEDSTGEDSIVQDSTYKKFAHLKLSTNDFEKLKASYSQQQIDGILTKIENYRQNTRYKSLYLTAKDWLKREHKKDDISKQREEFING